MTPADIRDALDDIADAAQPSEAYMAAADACLRMVNRPFADAQAIIARVIAKERAEGAAAMQERCACVAETYSPEEPIDGEGLAKYIRGLK